MIRPTWWRFIASCGSGYDCVVRLALYARRSTIDYPMLKLMLNRIANLFIRLLFLLRYNDVTNAFKALSPRRRSRAFSRCCRTHFNLTVELPLKCIVRGYRYAVVPNSWTQPQGGRLQVQDSRRWVPLPLHHPLLLAGAAAVAWRLPAKAAAGTLDGRPGADAQHRLGLRTIDFDQCDGHAR